ncbi:hypothetical protein F652_3314 [Enterobacteriaceae bacterium bta3-1]|nr:hypothetical protein F652_3314 [Enterobacteriaceae bacterium bta3-1]
MVLQRCSNPARQNLGARFRPPIYRAFIDNLGVWAQTARE